MYVANINQDGSLTEAVNLGETVNTIYDDKYPSVSIDGKDLYFSSKGHKTIGGFDVFKAKIIEDNAYGSVLNLGNTINTEFDEVAFFMASETKGYLSSDKSSGEGRYDVYKYDLKIVTQQLEGIIVDKETNTPLPQANIILVDEAGNEVATVVADENATFKFNVTPLETYTIKANKKGFEDKEVKFVAYNGDETTYKETVKLDAEKAVITEVENKRMIVVNNIYFDYNKATIKAESLIPLNSIIVVLKENPDMKIEINAHTDNRGNDNYNLKLSEQRAASAMAYLIANGISADRLISHGYGETQPKYDCKTECTENEHQENRRIEFVIR